MSLIIQGHLKKTSLKESGEIIDRFNNAIKSNQYYSSRSEPIGEFGFFTLTVAGSISTFKFICRENRIIHLIYMSDMFRVLWIGDEYPCKVSSEIDNYQDLLKEKVTEKSVKEKLTRKEKREQDQMAVIEILKSGGQVNEIINRKKK